VPFALIDSVAGPSALRMTHPRYTMIGADMETVTGRWAWRAEAAFFPDRPLQIEDEPGIFEGHVFEAGAGVDRRAGDFTLSASVLVNREEAATRVSRDTLATSARTNLSL